MKTTVIALIILLCSAATAQIQNNTYCVAGDTAFITAGSLGSYPSECGEQCTVGSWTSSDSTVLFPKDGQMLFIPPHNGTWTGTAYFTYAPTLPNNNEGCKYDAYNVTITAYGVGDSSVKLRSQYISVDMYEPFAGAAWDARYQITVDNNIASATVFKNLRFVGNLPPGLQVGLMNGNTSIAAYNAAVFERRTPLSVRFTLPGATIPNDLYFSGSLLLDAQSADTTLTLESQLYITVHQFAGAPASPSEKALSLAVSPNPAGKIATVSCVLPADGTCSYSITDLAGKTVFVSAPRRGQTGLNTFPLEAAELSPGEYFLTLSAGTARATTKLVIVR